MGRVGVMKPYLRPIYTGAGCAGSAVTVLAQPGDNWMIHVAVEQCQPGDVLVVAVTADNTDGMFGELLASSAFRSGLDATGQGYLVSTGRFALRGIGRAEDLFTLDPAIAADEVVAGGYERYLAG